MKDWLRNAIEDGEEGHAAAALPALVAGVGIIVLGLAAADGSDTWMVVGGIVAGVGLIAGAFWRHMTIDWDLYKRLDGKK